MTMGGPSHDNAPLHADGSTSGVEKKAYLPPTQDVNAPDLYIPIMAFTTYVVMIGLLKGTVGEFTPDVLSQVMMSSLFMECLEVLLIRVGFTITRVPPENVPSMDMAKLVVLQIRRCVSHDGHMSTGQLVLRDRPMQAFRWRGSICAPLRDCTEVPFVSVSIKSIFCLVWSAMQ